MPSVGAYNRNLKEPKFQPFIVNGQSILLPFDDLDLTASSVQKKIDATIGDLFVYVRTNQSAESGKSFAKICHIIIQLVLRIVANVQHSQTSRSCLIIGMYVACAGNDTCKPPCPVKTCVHGQLSQHVCRSLSESRLDVIPRSY
jgi:hypothetical protein